MNINIDLSKIYGYYAKQVDLLLKKMAIGHDEIAKEMKLLLNDLLYILNQYTDKPMNDISTEPHSLNDHMKGMAFVLKYNLVNKFTIHCI